MAQRAHLPSVATVLRRHRSWRLVTLVVTLLLLTSSLLVSAQSTDDATAQDGDAVAGEGGATGAVGILAFDDPDNFTLAGRLGVGTDVPSYNVDIRESRNGVSRLRVFNNNGGGNVATDLYLQTAGTGQGLTLAKFGTAYTGVWSGQPLANRAWLRSDTNVTGLILTTGGNAPLLFGANNVERMRIEPNGFVGINNSNPTSPLHIDGSVAIPGVPLRVKAQGNWQSAIFESPNLASIQLRPGGGDADRVELGNGPDGSFRILTYSPTSGQEVFKILRGGHVGIGNPAPNPSLRLHVVAEGAADAAVFESADDRAYAGIRLRPGGTAQDQTANEVALSTLPNGGFGILTYATPGQNGGWRVAVSRTGNVGIGTTDPSARLEIVGDLKLTSGAGGAGDLWLNNPSLGYGGLALTGSSDGSDTLVLNGVNTFAGGVLIQSHARVANNLVVGGFTTLGADLLMNSGPTRGDGGRALVHDGSDTLAINYNGDFAGGVRVDSGMSVRRNADTLELVGTDHTYLEFYPDGPQTRKAWMGFGSGTSNNVTIVNEIAGADIVLDSNNGKVVVDVLQITGGADLAEPFVITAEEAVEPGTVAILDADNPGQLRVSATAYDPLVAGIVSGAGGINPGLIMQQGDAIIEGESYPIALTGKVYVKAVGPIKIGDLLTTSDMPGYAMAATDRDRAFGATLGKAMSPLAEGTGLVLVLVALQ